MSFYLRTTVLALALGLIPGWAGAQPLPTQIQQFEQNPQHLDFLNKAIPPFSLDLHERLIVLPRYRDGSLYVEGGQGRQLHGVPSQVGVIARISRQGKLEWQTRLPNIAMTEPVVTQNRVIVGLGGNRMFFHNVGYGCYSPFLHGWVGLSRKTGQIKWTYHTHCQDMPTPFLAGNLVIGPTGGGRIIAVNAQTGKLVWQLPDGGWSAMSSPAVVGDTFYVGINGIHSSDTRMYAINWQTHTVKWSTPIPAAQNLSEPSPVVGQGLVFTAYMARAQVDVRKIPDQNTFPDWDFQVEALNAQTGKPVWTQYLYTEYAQRPRGFWKNLTEFGKIFGKGLLGTLEQAFPQDGINQYLVGNAPAKKHPGIHNPPLTYWKGLVFVEPRTGDRLYALDARSGRIRWSAATQPTIANPAIHHGLLYTVSMHGRLTVYKAHSGKLVLTKQLPLAGVGPTEVLLDKTGFVVGDMQGHFRSFTYPRGRNSAGSSHLLRNPGVARKG